MSWLARSIAHSLHIDDVDEDDDENDAVEGRTSNADDHSRFEAEEEQAAEDDGDDEDVDRSENQGRGVKEDLSELGQTLTRQLWGVASFLAPPPHSDRLSPPDSNRSDPPGQSGSGYASEEDDAESVFRGGFSNAGGEFRGGDLNFTGFLPRRTEEEIAEAVGVTEEVLAFAKNIAILGSIVGFLYNQLRFIVANCDFNMSDAQCKHAMAVECLAPRLAALRIELCPAHMSKGYFWKVYFVLLHSRLNKQDAELLSTSQIVSARSIWMQELQKRTKPEVDWYKRGTSSLKESAGSIQEGSHPNSYPTPQSTSFRASVSEPTVEYVTTELEIEKHPVSTDIQIIDKSVIKVEQMTGTRDEQFLIGPLSNARIQDYSDDGDAWLEEDSELEGYSRTAILVGTDDDVTFSDLEDDDDCTMPIKSKIVSNDFDISSKSS
ncbi:hypothetical protein RJ640_006034 [Escallonia rubra]|uniref:BSD domain-containing protein n=1 Tax=Escallonia rubra TaxID=112253 RepID=A0AA88RL25_9ASTE|nr:hypothetical protein RJ640_006034 [Escallonia rubra]